jgi:hypothetical protein
MNEIMLLILGFSMGFIFMILPLAISFPYVVYGIKRFFMNWKTRGAMGQVILRNLDGSLSFPLLANLKTNELKVGNKLFTLTKEMFSSGARMWGLPFVILDHDDVMCTVGFHFQRPVFESQGEDVPPKLVGYQQTIIKNSEQVSPELIKAFVAEKAMLQALKAFLDQNKLTLILVGASIGAGAIAAFFGYEIVSQHVPAILSKLDVIIGGMSL